MKNRIINLGTIATVARALEELNDAVVFVGGAVVSAYTDDDAADNVRPTEDIDLTVKLVDVDQIDLDKQLAKKGFHPDIHGHAICSYTFEGIAVDIMAAKDTMRGPTNRWYAIGFESLNKINIQDQTINILSAPCFIATKFEAFSHRGNDDYRTSHDFEDIVYVLDNRTTIVEEIRHSDSRVFSFLCDELKQIMDSPYEEEILSAHLNPLISDDRYAMLVAKIKAILE